MDISLGTLVINDTTIIEGVYKHIISVVGLENNALIT